MKHFQRTFRLLQEGVIIVRKKKIKKRIFNFVLSLKSPHSLIL